MITSIVFKLETTRPPHLTPLFSYYCGLFVNFRNVTTFRIKHMQTLLSNHRGRVSGPIRRDTRGWAAQTEFAASVSPFEMNTCKSVTKQRTSTIFRMNTYEKPGGRGVRPSLYSKILLTRTQFTLWPRAPRATTVSSRSQAQRVSPPRDPRSSPASLYGARCHKSGAELRRAP